MSGIMNALGLGGAANAASSAIDLTTKLAIAGLVLGAASLLLPIIMQLLRKTGKFSDNLVNRPFHTIAVLCVFCCVTFIIVDILSRIIEYFFPNKYTAGILSASSSAVGAAGKAATSAYRQVVRSPPVSDPLINLQFLAMNHAGAIPTSMTLGGGETVASTITNTVSAALQNGVRTFVLTIDYLDSDTSTPTLVIRNSDGVLKSRGNSDPTPIKTFMNLIATKAFNMDMPNADTVPIILVLNFLRTPAQSNTYDYLLFLSKVASQLSPISAQHLSSNEYGIFTSGQQSGTMFTKSTKAYAGNIILLTNADTSLFKDTSRVMKPDGTPANFAQPSVNLDYWIHARVYGDMMSSYSTVRDGVPAGAGHALSTYGPANPSGVFSGIGASADRKTNFTIVMPDPMVAYEATDAKLILDTNGTNIIPYDFYNTIPTLLENIYKLYNGGSYRLRTPNLLYSDSPTLNSTTSGTGTGTGTGVPGTGVGIPGVGTPGVGTPLPSL